MQKWEYDIESWTPGDSDHLSFRAFLNHRGDNGWELAAKEKVAGALQCLFKRPISQKTSKSEWLDKPDSYGLWLFSQKKLIIGYYDGLPFEVAFEVASDGSSWPKMIARDLCARADFRPITSFVGKWKKMSDEKPPEGTP